ncbi:MAG: NADH-quinone oxidoreductase subunit J [Nitrospirae bacterium]|nr:NADH-quinone oxidoreductase subunit J [Nitrospirota bacterium]
MGIEMKEVVFIVVALLTVVPCLIVAFSRNILYSAFSLFFTLLGTSGLYFFLDAEFLAIAQVVVYIGGVTVLLLFAILLTKNIQEIKETNALSMKRAYFAGASSFILLASLIFLAVKEWKFFEAGPGTDYPFLTLNQLGELMLNKYLLPFEAASILLLVVLIGSLVIAKRAVK